MIEMTGGTYAADARVAPRSTAPIAAPFQGRAVSVAASGNALGHGWLLRGKYATTTPSDSVSGALPA
jgi:hypothetical protein